MYWHVHGCVAPDRVSISACRKSLAIGASESDGGSASCSKITLTAVRLQLQACLLLWLLSHLRRRCAGRRCVCTASSDRRRDVEAAEKHEVHPSC